MPGTAGCPGGSTAGWPSGSFVAPAAKGQVMRSPEEFAAASFAYGHEPVETVESQEKEEEARSLFVKAWKVRLFSLTLLLPLMHVLFALVIGSET